ncbi:MAG: Trm112 family protein [Pseudomonadota bacterium]
MTTPSAEEDSERTSPKLLEALVCPLSGGTLEYDARAHELISRAARVAFPIRSGIPIMLVDEARRLED